MSGRAKVLYKAQMPCKARVSHKARVLHKAAMPGEKEGASMENEQGALTQNLA